MKKSVFVFGLLAGILPAATQAADLPAAYKAPALIAAYNWTGFYVGANVGGAMSNKRWDVFDPTPPPGFVSEGEHNAVGPTAGGQFGYRWQAASWVIGVEAQGNWAHLRGSNTSTFNFGQNNRTSIDSFGVFTGQIGYAWDATLFYVKGGGAMVQDRYRVETAAVNPVATLATARETRWGPVVGAGLEYGFTPNWSAALDYDHAFLGTRSINMLDPAGAIFQTNRIRESLDVVTLRVNYRFGPGAVVAKY